MADVEVACERDSHVDRHRQPQEGVHASAPLVPFPPAEEGKCQEGQQGQRRLQEERGRKVVPPAALRDASEQERGPRLSVSNGGGQAVDIGVRQEPGGADRAEHAARRSRPLEARPTEGGSHFRIVREPRMERVGRPHECERNGPDGQQGQGESREPGQRPTELAGRRGERGEGHGLGRERHHQGQDAQGRHQDERGELARQSSPGGQAGEEDARGRDAVSDRLEGNDAQEDEQRDREVRGHDLTVRQHVGAEQAQEERDRPGQEPEMPLGPEQHRRAQHAPEGHHRQTSPEEDPVPVVPFVEETVAELPLLAEGPRSRRVRHPDVQEQQRQRGQLLGQRRMLGVHPEVAEGQIGVAGRKVGRLVVDRGRGPHAGDGEGGVGQDPRREQAQDAELSGRRHATSSTTLGGGATTRRTRCPSGVPCPLDVVEARRGRGGGRAPR